MKRENRSPLCAEPIARPRASARARINASAERWPLAGLCHKQLRELESSSPARQHHDDDSTLAVSARDSIRTRSVMYEETMTDLKAKLSVKAGVPADQLQARALSQHTY